MTTKTKALAQLGASGRRQYRQLRQQFDYGMGEALRVVQWLERARAAGLWFDWEHDREGWYDWRADRMKGWNNTDVEPDQIETCLCRNGAGDVLAVLGAIEDASEDYRLCVMAELSEQALARLAGAAAVAEAWAVDVVDDDE